MALLVYEKEIEDMQKAAYAKGYQAALDYLLGCWMDAPLPFHDECEEVEMKEEN